MDPDSLEGKVQHLKELVRVSDSEALDLLKRHHGDLERVISYMESSGRLGGLEGGGAVTDPVARSAGDGATSTSQAEVDPVLGTEQDPIDLTKEGRDQDIQKALMLSMQDLQPSASGVISLEEQELSRALEASLRESNASLTKPVLALFQDPKNPHKRKRVGQTPVGLKNIGNTCWFSAVIQSLYHIPVFLDEILTYSPPPLSNGTLSHPPCVMFVLELQKIFALLHKSNRMYIDPSPGIQTLREAFSKEHSHTGAQQDVSEFTHKLLDWIENAFKLSLEARPSERRCNPIVKLFNGHYRTEGLSNDQHFANESDFGAYPVQVRGHSHLHDSLESATFDMDMQQQTFFSRFPPILVLELSRFHYNQTTHQAEKIHDQLDFDLELCVDRYLEENKAESCRRKKELDQLRKKIEELEARLECYTHYKQRPIPITDILSLTLGFVRDQTTWECGVEEGDQQAEKRARVSLHPSPRYRSEQELKVMEACLSRWSKELKQDMDDLLASLVASKVTLSAVYSDPLMNRTPYYLHAVLVHQGEASRGHYWAYTRKHPSLSLFTSPPLPPPSCSPSADQPSSQFTHQKHEKTDEVAEVGKRAASDSGTDGGSLPIQASGTVSYHRQLETGEVCVDVMQSLECVVPVDETVMSATQGVAGEGMEVEKCSSSLFGASSPLSTSGGKAGGTGRSWIKFNDVSVSEVLWEDVRKESLGGTSGNTSAYCLIYLNRELHLDWLDEATPISLCKDLLHYAEDDNSSFLREMINYDQTIQAASHISSVAESSGGLPPSPLPVVMSPAPVSGAVAAPSASAAPAGPRKSSLSLQPESEQATQAEDRSNSQELMQVDSPPPPPISPTLQTKLNALISAHQYNASQLAKEYVEPRTRNISAYAVHSGLSKRVVRLLALDDIALNYNDELVKLLAKKEFVHNLTNTAECHSGTICMLKQSYHDFLSLCWFFVQAIKRTQEASFPKALLMCLKAFQQHRNIQDYRTSLSLQPSHLTLLRCLRAKTLQEVSSMAYCMFESGSLQEGLQIACALVVPALSQIAGDVRGGSGCLGEEGDGVEVEVVEKVREEWCQCLNRPQLSEAEQDTLGDLLTGILDDSGGKAYNLPEVDVPSLDHIDRVTLTSDLSCLIGQLPQLLGSNLFVAQL